MGNGLTTLYLDKKLQDNFTRWKVWVYNNNEHLYYVPLLGELEKKEELRRRIHQEWYRTSVMGKIYQLCRFVIIG